MFNHSGDEMKPLGRYSLFLTSIAAVLLAPMAVTAGEGPSFDCKKKLSKVEGIICSNTTLSQLDKSLGDTYSAVRSSVDKDSQSKLLSSQKDWLQARAGICIAPVDWAGLFKTPISDNPEQCLESVYKSRIDELKNAKVEDFPVYWKAEAKTAYSITGDILLSNTNMVVADAKSFHLTFVKDLPQNQAMGDGSFDTADKLRLYKIEDPKSFPLISDNYLCDAQNAPTYIVTATDQQANNLSIAVFSGAKEPTWDKSFLANTTSLCGTYGYGRTSTAK